MSECEVEQLLSNSELSSPDASTWQSIMADLVSSVNNVPTNATDTNFTTSFPNDTVLAKEEYDIVSTMVYPTPDHQFLVLPEMIGKKFQQNDFREKKVWRAHKQSRAESSTYETKFVRHMLELFLMLNHESMGRFGSVGGTMYYFMFEDLWSRIDILDKTKSSRTIMQLLNFTRTKDLKFQGRQIVRMHDPQERFLPPNLVVITRMFTFIRRTAEEIKANTHEEPISYSKVQITNFVLRDSFEELLIASGVAESSLPNFLLDLVSTPEQQNTQQLDTQHYCTESVQNTNTSRSNVLRNNSDTDGKHCENLADIFTTFGMRKCIVWKPFWFAHVLLLLLAHPSCTAHIKDKKLISNYDAVNIDKTLAEYLQCKGEDTTLVEKYKRLQIPYLICKPPYTIARTIENAINSDVMTNVRVHAIGDLEERLGSIPAFRNIFANLLNVSPSDIKRDLWVRMQLQQSHLDEIAFPFPFAIPFVSYVIPITVAKYFGDIRAVVVEVDHPGEVEIRHKGKIIRNKIEERQHIFKLFRQISAVMFVKCEEEENNFKVFHLNEYRARKKGEWLTCNYSNPFQPPISNTANNSGACYFIVTGNNFFPGCVSVEVNDREINKEDYEILSPEIILLSFKLKGSVINKVEVFSTLTLPNGQTNRSSTWKGNIRRDDEAERDFRLCNIVPYDLTNSHSEETILPELDRNLNKFIMEEKVFPKNEKAQIWNFTYNVMQQNAERFNKRSLPADN